LTRKEKRDIDKLKRILKLTFIFTALLGIFIIISAVSLYFYENRRPPYIKLSGGEIEKYIDSLKKNGLTPVDYIVKKFDANEVVIIGEPHRIRQHYEFLTSLVEPLARSGVANIGLEFYDVSIQPSIDAFLSKETLDVELLRKIVLSDETHFFYQQLYDLFMKARDVRKKGLNINILALEPAGGASSPGKDLNMAKIAENVVKKGGKILIYCGAHHAFTSYSQPFFIQFKRPDSITRAGQYIKSKFRRRVFFVNIHYPLSKKYWFAVPLFLYQKAFCLPFSGIPDQVFARYRKPVGFDCDIDLFRDIYDDFSYYSIGYGRLKMWELSDGCVYLNPLSEDKFVTPLENICKDSDEIEYIRSRTKPRLHKYYTSREAAKNMLENNGLTPETILEELDIRGLDDVFPAVKK